MSFFVENGVAVVVALDFVFSAAALSYLGGCAAVNIGQYFAITVFDDFHECFVGFDKLEFIASFGIDTYTNASIERDSLLVVCYDDFFGRVEAVAFAKNFFFLGGDTWLCHIVESQDHVL